ncbi:MAG: hydrolase [Acidimicrobiaceae bacterium]|nr:hydrolase [Acidimicrobiaceae bacterium]
MASSTVRVAAVQLASSSDTEANIRHAIEGTLSAVASGATYVQLPEYFNYRGPTSRYLEVAESIPGPTTARLAEVAASNNITLHVGSMLERSPDPSRSYNTSVVIAPSGEIVATYRKGHLFDINVPGEVEQHESRNIAPGDRLVITDAPGFALGLSVCFDLRFTEMYRRLASHGAAVLAVPSSFAVATGRVHWEVLLRARAIENHAYVIAAAQAGTTAEGIASFGHSMIIGPWGEVLAESDVDGEDVLIATIDTREVDRRRSQIAVLALQRPDLYRSLPEPGGDE